MRETDGSGGDHPGIELVFKISGLDPRVFGSAGGQLFRTSPKDDHPTNRAIGAGQNGPGCKKLTLVMEVSKVGKVGILESSLRPRIECRATRAPDQQGQSEPVEIHDIGSRFAA